MPTDDRSQVTGKDDMSPRFVRDKASSNDFFNGSHRRIADGVASCILSDQDIRLIGLIGPWGSGKSTVIKLIREKLKAQPHAIGVHTFVYDAWLHQSDPHRRSFLEALVDFLSSAECKLTTKDQWQDDLDRLSRKVEDHDTQSTPTLTAPGRLIALPLFLVPLGISLIGKDWHDRTILGVRANDVSTPIGLLLTLGPILLIVAMWLWLFAKSTWKGTTRPDISTLFSVFVNKTVDRVSNRITRSPEPTAIEFQGLYHRVMQAVAAENRRFVFVIDNLDRIPESEALAIWSTIRSFFVDRSDEFAFADSTTGRKSNPWVIVPLDPRTVDRMFEPNGGAAATIGERARSFLDKSFDIIFRVAPPLLSDWQAYLQQQLLWTFDNAITPEDVQICIRLFTDEIRTKPGVYADRQPELIDVTPRRLNALVNRLAVLRLQWQSTLPFSALCWYAIHEQWLEEDIGRIVSGKSEQAARIEALDLDWRRSVCAIYFGVPPERALLVLIGPRLAQALETSDKSAFLELSQVPGFLRILESVSDEMLTEEDDSPAKLVRIAATLTVLPNASDPLLPFIWSKLVDRTVMLGRWSELPPVLVEGLKSIVQHAAEEQRSAVSERLLKSLSDVAEQACGAPEAPRLWLDAATALAEEIKPAALDEALAAAAVPAHGMFYLNIGVVASSLKNTRIAKKLRPAAIPTDVVGHFLRRAEATEFDMGAVDLFEFLADVPLEWPWQSIVEPLGKHVRSQTNLDLANGALQLLSRLWHRQPKMALPELRALQREGWILHLLANANNEGKRHIVATCIVAGVIADPSFAFENNGQEKTADGKSAVSEIGATNDGEWVALVLRELDGVGILTDTLVGLAEKQPLGALLRAIINRRVETANIGPLHVKAIIEKSLPDYSKILKDNFSQFVLRLTRYTTFWDELVAARLSPNAVTILTLLLSDESTRGEAAGVLNHILEEMNESEWREIMKAADGRGTLIAEFLRTDLHIELGVELSKAMLSEIDDSVTTSKGPDPTIFASLPRGLSAPSRRNFYRNVRDRLLSLPGTASPLWPLQTLGTELIQVGEFDKESDKVARLMLVRMLGSAHSADREWVYSHARDLAACIQLAPEDARNEIQQIVSDQIANRPDDAEPITALAQLAADWGLRLTNESAPKMASSDEREASSEDAPSP